MIRTIMGRRRPIKRAPLKRSQKPIPKKRSRPRRKANGEYGVEDPEYKAWIHTRSSIVGGYNCAEAPLHYLEALDIGMMFPLKIESHHHIPGDDHSLVPLYRMYHVDTPFSVHGGGGRRAFERRFGVVFSKEIERLLRLYEQEKGG